MRLFGFLRVLDSITDKGLVGIDHNKCMRYLNKHSTCSRCQDHCPTGAITLVNQDIKMDGFLCTGCGICVNTCPNPVFALEDVDFESVIKAAGESGQIDISCHRGGSHLQVPCLGYLNEALLLYLASSGKEVILNDSACLDCDYNRALPLIKSYVEAANSVLADTDQSITINEKGSVNKIENKSFTRKLVTQFSDTKPAHRHTRQSLFVDAVGQLGLNRILDAQWVPIGNIDVKPSCNGCGICAAVCPVDALFAEDDSRFILKFKPDICTGCGLCSQLCPNNSIYLMDHIDPQALSAGECRTVIEIEKLRCDGCGKLSIINDGIVLCASCQKNKDIEDSFFSDNAKEGKKILK